MFLAPEILVSVEGDQGAFPINIEAQDIWSLGCLLVQILTTEDAFQHYFGPRQNPPSFSDLEDRIREQHRQWVCEHVGSESEAVHETS